GEISLRERSGDPAGRIVDPKRRRSMPAGKTQTAAHFQPGRKQHPPIGKIENHAPCFTIFAAGRVDMIVHAVDQCADLVRQCLLAHRIASRTQSTISAVTPRIVLRGGASKGSCAYSLGLNILSYGARPSR